MDFNKNSDEILEEFLADIPDTYEKRKGYFLWDILKSIAIRLKDTLSKITNIANKLDIENLEERELEIFINQRTGIERKRATYSQGILTLSGNGVIKIGDLFETEGLIRFRSTEEKNIVGEGNIKIESVIAGKIGNVPKNSITKMPITIQGIVNCTNEYDTDGGYDDESDYDLRERYYERLREPATSGNIYHYKQWAKEVEGVGEARVVPLWNGANTVKVIIINIDRQPAETSLVEKVQEYIDPNITGEGRGEAPIGAFCTVESAKAKEITVSVKIIFSSSYNLNQIKINVEEQISSYLQEIAFKNDILSYAIIGSKILNVDGILDYSELKINNLTSSIECLENEVFILERVDFIE